MRYIYQTKTNQCISTTRAGILGFVKIGQGFSQMSKFEIALYDPLWATIQQGCSVVCCCVPIYKPLIPDLGLFSRIRSFGSRTFGRRSGSGSTGTREAKLPLDSLQASATSWDQGPDNSYYPNEASPRGPSMQQVHDGAYIGVKEPV
jgi:hypothetical protein